MKAQRQRFRLACIYPIRESPSRDVIARIDLIESDSLRPGSVEVVLVDDGCGSRVASDIEAICRQRGYIYLKSGSEADEPCMSRARNFGAMHADADYVVFHDIDLVLFDGYFARLLQQIETAGLDQNANDFLALPVLYLTKDATARFFQRRNVDELQALARSMQLGDSSACDHLAEVSSVNVIDRHYYLMIGGYNEQFRYWGYEDSEFAHRIVKLSRRYPLPMFYHWHLDHQYTHQVLYVGWRSAFRLWGDESRSCGLLIFHAWHEHLHTDYRAQARIDENRRRFLDASRRIKRDPLYLRPLENHAGPLTAIVRPREQYHPVIHRFKALFGNVLMDVVRGDDEAGGWHPGAGQLVQVERLIIVGHRNRCLESEISGGCEVHYLRPSVIPGAHYFVGADSYAALGRVGDARAVVHWLLEASGTPVAALRNEVLVDSVDDFGDLDDYFVPFVAEVLRARRVSSLQSDDASPSRVLAAIKNADSVCSNRLDVVLIGLLLGKTVFTDLSFDNDAVARMHNVVPRQINIGPDRLARLVSGFYSIFVDDRCMLSNFGGHGAVFAPGAKPRIGFGAAVFDRYRLFLYLTWQDFRGVKVWSYSMLRLLRDVLKGVRRRMARTAADERCGQRPHSKR